jgi:hypothetical protein
VALEPTVLAVAVELVKVEVMLVVEVVLELLLLGMQSNGYIKTSNI